MVAVRSLLRLLKQCGLDMCEMLVAKLSYGVRSVRLCMCYRQCEWLVLWLPGT